MISRYLSLIILCILLFAVVVRLPKLSGSFWLDEAGQALESSRPFLQQHQISWDFQPPLFHYLTHFLLQISRNEGWLRITSLASGIGSVYLLSRLLKDRVSGQAAIWGGLFLATAPLHIFYSQELRPYMLATFFAVASWTALLQAITGDVKGERDRSFYLYVFFSILGMYSMYLYPFVILAQWIYTAREHKNLLQAVSFCHFVVGLCFLPWLPFFLEQLKVGTGWTDLLPGWAEVVATPQLKAVPLVFLKFVLGPVEYKALGGDKVLLAGVLLLVLLFGYAVWKKPKTRFLVYWFVIPLIATWVVSFIVPVIQPKRLLIITPAFFGILGTGVTILGSRYKKLGIGIGIFVLLSLGWFSARYFHETRFQREDWKALVVSVQEDCKDSTCVALFAFNEAFAPWKWYETTNFPIASLSTFTVQSEAQVDLELIGAVSGKEKVYVFDYLRDISDPNRVIEQRLEAAGFREEYSLDGKLIGFVRVFTPKQQ